jgi:hypothetical protein
MPNGSELRRQRHREKVGAELRRNYPQKIREVVPTGLTREALLSASSNDAEFNP